MPEPGSSDPQGSIIEESINTQTTVPTLKSDKDRACQDAHRIREQARQTVERSRMARTVAVSRRRLRQPTQPPD